MYDDCAPPGFLMRNTNSLKLHWYVRKVHEWREFQFNDEYKICFKYKM